MKLKLAAIAKNEGAYLPRWIFHHLHFGFDQIEVWVNDSTDNSEKILRMIGARWPERIRIVVADEFLKQCLDERRIFQKKRIFQIQAYNKIFAQTKQEAIFSHIMFLDLDELWTPADFETSIKQALSSFPEADTVSFQWYFDSPDLNRPPFSPTYQPVTHLQKNRHVKTSIKVSERIRVVYIHNAVVDGGSQFLSTGEPMLDEDDDQQSKSLISKRAFESRKLHLDNYFILHETSKSRKEYISSLLRGRSHVGDRRPFKVNRWGYVPEPKSQSGLALRIDEQKLSGYRMAYERFLRQAGIEEELSEAQIFCLGRYEQALTLLSTKGDLLEEYSRLFRGTFLNDFIEPPINANSIKYSIGKVEVNSAKTHLVVRGWVFDTLSSAMPEIVVTSASGREIAGDIHRVERPDVTRTYPEAGLTPGFRLAVSLQNLERDARATSQKPFDITFRSKSCSIRVDRYGKNTPEEVFAALDIPNLLKQEAN